MSGGIELRGVGRRYGLGGPWVLRGVDLDVPPRSLLRIEGANGTGKSTLLRLLAGIDAPSAGRITGRPRTAYVPERFPPALPFSTSGYLAMIGRVHGLGRSAAKHAAADWLERFGAGAHARTPLAELSKGTSQKVAVAQALLAAPELLVLDEAWTGLDRTARDILDGAVRDRVAEGGAVVFVDHDPRRLAGAADAVYRVASDGRVAPAETAAPDGVDTAGPRVRITAQGPPGATLPRDLPGAPACEPEREGTVGLTVPATHSDAVLSALLAARPAWHIREVAPVHTGEAAGPKEEPPPTSAPSQDSSPTQRPDRT
ncbi:ATP-binding cassette domain-containing protein [Streptomyces sp. NPDC050610]|uniref:ABC transporter ATP-binding protein n=1 Tax=Streptomyces sp. NPDC050610 TaxID=3157097 RepID=UPI00341BA902